MEKLTLNKWGNSQGIRIPAKLLQQLQWTNAKSFNAEISEDHQLILSVAEDQDDGSLAYLFKEYEDDGIREPLIDFGESMGEEAW
ncbi:AbrB/MazE/SpoVT family DNA-binding domain-containing protein [Lactovum odontotermitis]